MKKKIIVSIAICIPLLLLVASVVSDGHNTNLRYLMWKWGWTDYSQEISMRYMACDSVFRNSLEGKTKTEITKWFPDLRTETNSEKYLDSSEPFYISTSDFLWIGNTQWAIGFEKGKVAGFALIKGWPKLEDRRIWHN